MLWLWLGGRGGVLLLLLALRTLRWGLAVREGVVGGWFISWTVAGEVMPMGYAVGWVCYGMRPGA